MFIQICHAMHCDVFAIPHVWMDSCPSKRTSPIFCDAIEIPSTSGGTSWAPESRTSIGEMTAHISASCGCNAPWSYSSLTSIGYRSVKVTSLDGGIARQNDSTGIGIETSVSMNGPMGTQTLDVTIFIKQFYSSTTSMNNWKN